MPQALPIERVVTLLGPFFAAGASFVTGFIAQHTGVQLNPIDVGVVETGAFLGTIALVIKWLHGRQIPEIAGLHVTQAQLDELHGNIADYLRAHGTDMDAAEQRMGAIARAELEKFAPQFAPDIDAVVSEVLKRLSHLAEVPPPVKAIQATPGSTPAQ